MRTSRQHGVEVVEISSPDGKSHASFVPVYGGIGSSLVLGGRELLYQHDFFWDPETPRTRGGWPFLFPNCGRLARDGENGHWLYHGTRYPLPSHGFGPKVPWTAEAGEEDNELRLVLSDTASTRAMYPFAFRVEITYRIENTRFVAEPRFTNMDACAMPVYAGFHPYIATPPPDAGKEKVTIMHRPSKRLAYNSSLDDLIGEAPCPVFPQAVTSPELRELLTVVPTGNEIVLSFPDGFSIHTTTSEHYGYVQHYTMEEKGFFCFEPWMSHPNSFNTAGACTWIPPGTTLETRLDLWTD